MEPALTSLTSAPVRIGGSFAAAGRMERAPLDERAMTESVATHGRKLTIREFPIGRRQFQFSLLCNSRIVSSWQMGLAHQKSVALAGGAAPFVDRPNHQALAAPAITRREYSRHVGGESSMFRLGVGARIPFHAKL